MNELETLGQVIRRRRKELKITAEELARSVGVDRTFISKIEKHGMFPSRVVLQKIEEKLKFNLLPIYIREKNPFLEKRNPEYYAKLPLYAKKDFQNSKSERLYNFILRQVEAHATILQPDALKVLLKDLAPERIDDEQLRKDILAVLSEMKREKDDYWRKFLQNAKRIELLISKKLVPIK